MHLPHFLTPIESLLLIRPPITFLGALPNNSASVLPKASYSTKIKRYLGIQNINLRVIDIRKIDLKFNDPQKVELI